MRIRIKKYFNSVTDPYPTSEENTIFFILFYIKIMILMIKAEMKRIYTELLNLGSVENVNKEN